MLHSLTLKVYIYVPNLNRLYDQNILICSPMNHVVAIKFSRTLRISLPPNKLLSIKCTVQCEICLLLNRFGHEIHPKCIPVNDFTSLCLLITVEQSRQLKPTNSDQICACTLLVSAFNMINIMFLLIKRMRCD